MNTSSRDMSVRAFSRALTVTPRRPKAVLRSPLKTHQLALLVQLDEERRLARAAEVVGLTQPAASKLLRQIETTLEVTLFERHARGLVPTRYGEILIRHARLALSELRLAHEELAALKGGGAGQTAVGTIIDPGTNLVPRAIAALKQSYPDMLVHIEVDSSRRLVERLLQGHLDVAIARLLDPDVADEATYEPLAQDEPHAVVASARHPLAGREDLQLEELIEQPWILPPPGSLVRDKLAAMFLQEGLAQPGNIVEASSIPVVTSLLAHSNMIVALPEAAVHSYCEAGMLTLLMRALPLGIGGFGLIMRRNCRPSAAAQLTLSALRHLAAQLYPARVGH